MIIGNLHAIADQLWLYLTAPLLLIAGLWLTWKLRGAQFTRLLRSGAALRSDAEADGLLRPIVAVLYSSTTGLSALAVLGAATAISLGGTGILAWVWLFAILFGAFRFAEALLSRTNPAGMSDRKSPKSILQRALRQGGAHRIIGGAAVGCLAIGAFGYAGAYQGLALRELAATTDPSTARWIPLFLGLVGAFAFALGLRRLGRWIGPIALVALVALATLGLWAGMSDAGRFFRALGRAIPEATGGAPAATPFSGASPSEIMIAALVWVLPAFAVGLGITGRAHGEAQAQSTRQQARAALLEPLIFATVVTILGCTFVATGSYFRRVETHRGLHELTMMRTDFESLSQRQEEDRRYSGYIRIEEGEMRDIGPRFATERGTIRQPTFRYEGEPADISLRYRDGIPTRLMVNQNGVLADTSLGELRQVTVAGNMLPRGGALAGEALHRGTGQDSTRFALLFGLLLLGALGLSLFGHALVRASGARGPLRWLVGLLPAAGAALAATDVASFVEPAGRLGLGVGAALLAVLFLLEAGAAGKLSSGG
ncbi:MAG: hypothetical protein AAGF12_30180 [Myxococcota bacterium]